MKRKLFSIAMILALVISLMASAVPALAQGEEGGEPVIKYHPSEPFSPPIKRAPQEISYDDGVAEGAYAWNVGYENNLFAVRFTPPSYPAALTTARLCLSPDFPDADHEQFAIEVYDDDGPGGAPGTLLGSVNTTPTAWGWCDVDISGLGITVTEGDFYIAYKQTTVVPDCEALCVDETSPDGRSWVQLDGTWYPVEVQIGTLDWMIRCIVDVGPPAETWTFMVYLDGDNNLEPVYINNFNFMEYAADNPNVNVVVQFDRIPGFDSSNGDWTNTKRYLVKHDTDLDNFASYTEGVDTWDMAEQDMSDPAVLAAFITWARTNFPADHYLLALVNHGGGWEPKAPATLTGMLWDDTSGVNEYMSTGEMGLALDAAGCGIEKLDVLFLDACLMHMIEIAYQVRNYADYMVASEMEGWAPGPFNDYISSIGPTTTGAELATTIVNAYHSWLTGSYPHTMSALDLAQLPLAQEVSDLADALTAGLPTYETEITNARTACQKFDSNGDLEITNDDEYLDLYHFAWLIDQNIADAGISAAAQVVYNRVSSAIIAEQHESMTFDYPAGTPHTWNLDDSHGISIYFPPSESVPSYGNYDGTNLAFVAGKGWDEFLDAFFFGVAPSVLIYSSDWNLVPGLPSYPEVACQNLGLSYIATNDGIEFASLLGSGDWDIVVIDEPSNTIKSIGGNAEGLGAKTDVGSYDAVTDYIAAGGKVIISTYGVSWTPADPVWPAFGIATYDDNFTSPQDVYQTAAHPIWDGIPSPITSWVDSWADDGDFVTASGDSEVIAEFGDGHDAIILHGNTIYNAFLLCELVPEVAPGVPTAVRLWENEIEFLLTPEPEVPDWTFMVYLGADNNLNDAGIDDLNEMEVAGSTADINIVALLDLLGEPNSNIYYVTQDADPLTITSPVVSALGEVNMGDPTTLSDFALWTMANYPAEHYALVLWDHGSGWKLRGEAGAKGVCWDDTSGFDKITSPELKAALETIYTSSGVALDIVGFDACLMGMMEIFHLVAPYADIGVASEEAVPEDGWPYDPILLGLTASPAMLPADLATSIVNEYMTSYGASGAETLSAVQLSDVRSPALAADVSAFAASMMASGEISNISLARALTESFFDPDYIDLYHFAELVKSWVIDATVQADAQAVMDAIDLALIAEGHGALHPDAHGVSIYYPPLGGYLPGYDTDLDFTLDTQWDEFLSWILATLEPYFYDVYYTPFDSGIDGLDDAVQVEMDVDIDDDISVEVTVYCYLHDPDGMVVDDCSLTWTIYDWSEADNGFCNLYAPAGYPEGWYDVVCVLYYLGSSVDVWWGADVAYLYPEAVEEPLWVEIITDPVGDQYWGYAPDPDIVGVDAALTNSEPAVAFRVRADQPIDPYNHGSVMFLDTDQDPLTGYVSDNAYIPTNDIGADYRFDAFSAGGPAGETSKWATGDRSQTTGASPIIGTLRVWNPGVGSFEFVTNFIPVFTDTNYFWYQIPLSLLGDDGIMDVVGVLGTWGKPTDAAPNAGHGTSVAPPDIRVEPTEFNVTLPPDETWDGTLEIWNDGGAPLTYDITDFETTITAGVGALRPGAAGAGGAVAPLEAFSDKVAGNSSEERIGTTPVTPSYNRAAPAQVALFEDSYPWGYTAIEDILSAHGISYDVYTTSQMGIVDLSPYDKVITASVQGDTFWNALEANKAWFESYASAGGVLEMHLCAYSSSNSPGKVYPGGFVFYLTDIQDISIVDPTHPVLNTPNTITDGDLDNWNSSAHGWFDAIPAGGMVVLKSTTNDEPVWVETEFGSGLVFATTQTVEWIAGHGYPQFLENMILYMPTVPDCPWLDEDPKSGSVPSVDNHVIDVSIDTTGMAPGDYSANIVVANNDPDENPTIVPVNLTVEALPDIRVEPTEFNVTMLPDDTWSGTLEIWNDGGASLTYDITDVETTMAVVGALRPGAAGAGGAVEPLEAFSDKVAGNSSEERTGTTAVTPSYNRAAPAQVALFEDSYPWGSAAIEDILSAHGISYDVYTTSQMGIVDLSPYDKVITASVQGNAFWNALEANKAWFESYASAGGVLEMHLCAFSGSNSPGKVYPGGFVFYLTNIEDISIVDPTHSVLNTPNTIIDGDLDNWSYSAHGWFDAIPAGGMVVLKSTANDEPVWVETEFGSGLIFATTQTVEWRAGHGYPQFLENMILYMPTVPDCPWLDEDPKSGTVPSVDNHVIDVSIDTTGMAPGDYSANIVIANNDPDEDPTIVPVNLTINPPPEIGYDPTSFSFTAIEGGANPADQTLWIRNDGDGSIDWSVSDDAGPPDWLSLIPPSGTSTGEMDEATLSVDIAGMSAGSYSATITIEAPEAVNTPQTASVTLTINLPPGPPEIGYDPTSFSFTATEGGSNPADQTLWIRNDGEGTLDWSVSDDAGPPDWLSLIPPSGTSTGEMDEATLSVDITGMSAGSYSCTINIEDPEATNSPQTASVSLTINPPPGPPEIGYDPTSFSFTATEGGANPADQSLWISNDGDGSLDWSVSDDAGPPDWLSLIPPSGTSTGEMDEVTLSVDITGMSAGSYSCTINIEDPEATNTPQTASVNLTINLPPGPPEIGYNPTSFSFTATEGGANPASQSLWIRNDGDGSLDWSVSDDAGPPDWLSLIPPSGTSTGEMDEVTLSVDITGMSAGSYSATITIEAPGASNTPQTASVSLTINLPPGPPEIGYNPTSFSFTATEGGANPASQSLWIRNDGDGSLDWSVSDDAGPPDWLSLIPPSGTSTGEMDEVTLSVDISGMSAGSYSATITIEAPGASNTPQTASVSLTINLPPGPPEIWYDPTSFSFTATEGGPNPADQTLWIRNDGDGSLDWSVSDDAGPPDWLSLIPPSGTSTGEMDEVTLSVDITGMSAGNYSCTITIEDPEATNSPQTALVSLTIGPPEIGYDPTSFSFTATEGGANPADQTLGIWNSGGGSLNWSVSDDAGPPDWLSLIPPSGTSTGEVDDVTLSVDITGMSAGSYSATITIEAAGASNTPQTASVNLTINPLPGPPEIGYDPTSFSFTATEGGANPADQTLGISNDGDGSLDWSVSDDAGPPDWLSLIPPSGTSTGEVDDVTLSVDISGMSAGSYSATITIEAAGASNTPQTASVSLTINPAARPPAGGGGGGGTRPRGPELDVDMMGRVASGPITEDGVLEDTINVTSRDGMVTLRLPEGILALDSEGNRLEKITVDPVLEPPALPENWYTTGMAYDFGPDGASFEGSIELTIGYDPEELAEGVNEWDLVIGYYHSGSPEWRLLPSVVDTGAHTVTSSTGQFSVFAIIGRTGPAFTLADLSISPSEVDAGESVTISAQVTNSGGMEGSYTITLLIDGTEEATQELSLAPGASDTVNFAVTRDSAGTYSVEIDGLAGEFTVQAQAHAFPWALFGGILGGVLAALAAAIAVYLVIFRRRRAAAYGDVISSRTRDRT